MPISSPKRGVLFAVVMAVAVAASGFAHALDAKSIEKEKRSPWAVFRLGFSAYKKGDKEEAVQAYRYAADNGQVGASWKLAKMYAAGDGVTRDDYQAYKFFRQIVEDDVRPGSPDESYVSDALVALANYSRTGIPGSPVTPDLSAAQDFYMRAAATYRNPVAQFELGKMFLNGDGVKASIKQAGRWLQLAAEKGHAGAQATLGNLLFQSGKIVRGLAMMTEALSHAPAADLPWIRQMQEEAFALAGEGDRRTAIALADSMREGGDDGK